MKNKSLFVMLLAIMMMFIIVPVDTNAATNKVPAKVMNAVNKCVDENGRCIVVDQKAGKMYLFKKYKGEWKLKKIFNCIVSEKLNKRKHYFLHRSKDFESILWGTETERWSYGIHIDCYEYPKDIIIHSYTERYTGYHWIKDKSKSGNTFGIATCEENARYLWRYYKDGTAVMGC